MGINFAVGYPSIGYLAKIKKGRRIEMAKNKPEVKNNNYSDDVPLSVDDIKGLFDCDDLIDDQDYDEDDY